MNLLFVGKMPYLCRLELCALAARDPLVAGNGLIQNYLE